MTIKQRQSGAVSIFIVIFASLLMVVITMSFVQLMLKDQTQATSNDLSQSALDAAQAGVEDGKRLLLVQQSCQNGTVQAGYAAKCPAVETAIGSEKCNTVAAIFGNPTDKETVVQQSTNDVDLQQAYTCVKITPDTFDYQKRLIVGQSQVVPLKSTGAFDTVALSWYSNEDVSSGATAALSGGATTPLTTTWPANTPPIIRAQFIQTGGSFTLADFDTNKGANSVFLYPKSAGTNIYDTALDARRTASSGPVAVRCTPTFSPKYACTVRITYNQPPAPVTFANRGAYLRLNSIYGGAYYSVQLFNGATPVAFDGVQPIIDVTGRANDKFRRVLARVELAGSFTYPEAAIDLQNDLCKDFGVTADSYTPNTCDPATPRP